MTTTADDIVNDLVRVLDAYENKTQLYSNQGQALDGYSALANFLDIAERARNLRNTETAYISKLISDIKHEIEVWK